jgi:hypothetical protein
MKPTGMCLRVVLGMGEADCHLASNLYHHHIYNFRDLVVALVVGHPVAEGFVPSGGSRA